MVRRLCSVSRFEELRRREGARAAILYAFDLIEQGGEDLRARAVAVAWRAVARSWTGRQR
jgi:ATP-dependent DNA ligase